MNLLYVGTIIGTHGIKGELKIKSDFEKKDVVFKPKQNIYINNVLHTINTIRIHKNNYLVTIDSLTNINDVLEYVKSDVYIKREDLDYNSYLMSDLIGYGVYEANKLVGFVETVLASKAGYLLKIKDYKNFYIPFNTYYIIDVIPEDKRILVVNTGGLNI